ncbi:MAG: hypothetical protein ACREAC_11410 [Blastocatellia bacterium]
MDFTGAVSLESICKRIPVECVDSGLLRLADAEEMSTANPEMFGAKETPAMRVIRAAIAYFSEDATTPCRMATLVQLIIAYNELAYGMSGAQLPAA